MKFILGCVFLFVSIQLIRVDSAWMLWVGGVLLVASIILISDERTENAIKKLKKDL